MPNVPGRWLREPSIWRKISLNTWKEPDNATIYGVLDIEAGPLMTWLQKRTEESGIKVTMTHAVSRALAILMRKHPSTNVLVRGRKIWLRDKVDIFHQVAMPVPGNPGKTDLSGVTVRNVDTLRVEGIAQVLRAQAEKVRKKEDGEMARTRNTMFMLPEFLLKTVLAIIGWLTYDLNLVLPTVPRDPFGGAMVTAVGMFGIKTAFAPIVTFSKAPIVLLIGEIEDRVVAREGQVVIRKMCTITAAMDHRVLDGFVGGLLASGMQKILENPELLDADPSEV